MLIYLQGRSSHLLGYPLFLQLYIQIITMKLRHSKIKSTTQKPRSLTKRFTYSVRRAALTRAEGEDVRGRGRRTYGAASERESTRTGLPKCLAESGRPGQISIIMTFASSNRAPFLLHLQFFWGKPHWHRLCTTWTRRGVVC